jgi:hypothetical protein
MLSFLTGQTLGAVNAVAVVAWIARVAGVCAVGAGEASWASTAKFDRGGGWCRHVLPGITFEADGAVGVWCLCRFCALLACFVSSYFYRCRICATIFALFLCFLVLVLSWLTGVAERATRLILNKAGWTAQTSYCSARRLLDITVEPSAASLAWLGADASDTRCGGPEAGWTANTLRRTHEV